MILGDRDVLGVARRAHRARAEVRRLRSRVVRAVAASSRVWHQPLVAPPSPGHPDPTNGVERRRDAARAPAMPARTARSRRSVTAPVQKSAHPRRGLRVHRPHRILRRSARGTPRVVMMLRRRRERRTAARRAASRRTSPLADVPAAITRDAVRETLAIVDAGAAPQLRHRRAAHRRVRPQPACRRRRPPRSRGTRRHRAGDRGRARRPASTRTGPMPADTVFVPAHARGYDAIVAMYHDQGLPGR